MRFLSRSWVIGRGVVDFSISRAMALASYMPTQIGRTVSLFTSFKITIGILVAGSMTRPRIFISTSMVNSLTRATLRDGLADKAVGVAVGNPHRNITSRSGTDQVRSREVDGLVLRAAANTLASLAVNSFNRRFHHFSYVPGVTSSLNFTLAVEEHLQTTALLLFRDAVAQRNRRSVG